MKSKHWLSIFFILLFIGIGSFMFLNYTVDPLGYFAYKKGATVYDPTDYSRAAKTEYLTDNPDKYDALIIGGSKAGVLSTELLSSYTGKNYYNFYNNIGNFYDYLTYGKYLIDHTAVTEITLHLSSYEVDDYTKTDSQAAVYQVPALVSGSKWQEATEYLNFLMTDIKTTMEAAMDDTDVASITYNDLETGCRHWVKGNQLFEEDPDAYVKKYSLKDLNKNLKQLFNEKANSKPAFDDNIAALRELKAYCDEKGITLKVMIGASFLSERNIYECTRYYDYLRQIVEITDVWDFSGYHDINLNPYNFINRKHYDNAVADLMLDTMYGGNSVEGFGVWLTEENIDAYLAERKAGYEALKEEYETTGAIVMPDMDDPSYIR